MKEEGIEKPLASFNEQEDAIQYAQDLVEVNEGSTVKAHVEQVEETRAF